MDNVALYKPMLDWWATNSAASWILGLSIILACLAYCDWLAHDEQRPLPELLRGRNAQGTLVAGLLLVFGGLAAADQPAPQRVALLAAGIASSLCLRWLARSRSA